MIHVIKLADAWAQDDTNVWTLGRESKMLTETSPLKLMLGELRFLYAVDLLYTAEDYSDLIAEEIIITVNKINVSL